MNQEFTGRAIYVTDKIDGPFRLVVAVPCEVGDLPERWSALLDTGSEWCVLPADLAAATGYASVAEEANEELHTRFGILRGSLQRIPVTFPAADGDPLVIEATWFVSDEWPGPIVIGWKGCLERMRFALNPTDDVFYFASLEV